MENLIDIMQLSTEEIDELVKTGCDIMEHPAKYAHKEIRKQHGSMHFVFMMKIYSGAKSA